MTGYSAHRDSFARDNLPPRSQWPSFINLDRLGYPQRINCAVELLDKAVEEGHGNRDCVIAPERRWRYGELQTRANRIAHALTDDLKLVPGERVLLRSANNPMMLACWLAIVKAGGIVVATMPLLRAQELQTIADKAKVRLALCDERLRDEMDRAGDRAQSLDRIVYFNGDGQLEALLSNKSASYQAVDTAADDVCLIAFTSGTTGKPKGTVHFHRDVMAICDTFSRQVLRPRADDVFIGSPPLAFTFGLGGLALFPLHARASTVLLESAPPDQLLDAIDRYSATTVFTAPTAYRAMLAGSASLASLRQCVSAGETLPLPTANDWHERTGIRLIDGMGSTEMLHVFIAATADDIRPGATGKPIPCYQAKIVAADGSDAAPNSAGRLAVRGPTGCRYLADERQTDYVVDGWNLTGDTFRRDDDGYFWFEARADDMIVSAGYNIAGPEVEDALLAHQAVAECAVVAAPDADRGNIVKAFVVVKSGQDSGQELIGALQDFVKARIAPYKYPRAIEFVDGLPRTETGKVQRFKLRQQEAAKHD